MVLSRLKKLARAFSPDEFTVDEKPVEVIDFAKLARESGGNEAKPAAESESVESAPADVLNVPGVVGADLMSAFGEILAEHGRLSKLAQELKPAGPQDDEFGRFARQAITFIDGFDRIVDLARTHPHSEEITGWLRSVEVLYERVLRLFENYGLKVINCLGQKVDFNLHDVIEYRRTTDYPHNTVIQEIRKGIIFRGRVIRDAKVIIACNDEEQGNGHSS